MVTSGGCVAFDTEGPLCPPESLLPVSEADAPEAWETLGATHARVEVTRPGTSNLAGILEIDVVELSSVQFVEQSPACSSDVGHRARAIVDVHTQDGSLSVRVPALISLFEADGTLEVGFLDDEIDLPPDSRLPAPMLAQGAIVAGLALEVGDGEVTLSRVDIASSCTDRATCSAKERTAIVSWAHNGLDPDMWFDEVPL